MPPPFAVDPAGEPEACGERGLDSPDADEGGQLSPPLLEALLETGALEPLLELLLYTFRPPRLGPLTPLFVAAPLWEALDDFMSLFVSLPPTESPFNDFDFPLILLPAIPPPPLISALTISWRPDLVRLIFILSPSELASVPPLPGAELIFGGFCPPLEATDETIGEPGSEEARILGPTAAPGNIFIYR